YYVAFAKPAYLPTAVLGESIVVVELNGPGGIRGTRAFDGVPEDTVQGVFRTLVGPFERQTGRGVGFFAQQRVGKVFRLGIHAVERDVIGDGVEWREIGGVGETIEHRRGGGIELVHGQESQDQLDGAQQAGLI